MIRFSGNLSKNFSQEEYHAGSATVYMYKETVTFIKCIQAFRNWLNKPMYVVSWYRTREENMKVGGIVRSNHLTGTACDWHLYNHVISTDEFNWNSKRKKCYFSYEQRKALVESIRYVDLVIPEESWEQKKSDMHEYHIDTFVIGDDWKGKFDFLKDEGVEVVYLPRTPEISSSQIKKDLYDANAVDGESKTSHDEIETNPK
jgi:glycerol-3-phosphate cytidylyltransferase